jgi:hypothetical protein
MLGQVKKRPWRLPGEYMSGIRFLALAAVAAVFIAASTPKAEAQISINIGVAPACPYGYYDYTPYGCAPYGYYGPEWFRRGAFIGVGPWFHGPNNFYGHVNNRYDPHYGYSGRMPNNGERPRTRDRAPRGFRGNEMRDGRGHPGGDEPGGGDNHGGGDRH